MSKQTTSLAYNDVAPPKAVVYGHMISQCFHREMKIAITKTFIQGDCKILVDEIVDVTKINKKASKVCEVTSI